MHQLRRDYVDEFNTRTNNTAQSGQMICYNCEELVSRSASQCPYCQASLSSDPVKEPSTAENTQKIQGKTDVGFTKITQLKSSPISSGLLGVEQTFQQATLQQINKQKSAPLKDESFTRDEEHEFSPTLPPPLIYIIALISFLLGGALFFFGIAIPLLAKDGIVVLSWEEGMWLPFLGSGLLFLSIGYIFLNKIEKVFDTEE